MLSPEAGNVEKIGRYRLIQEVGSGGMARVYRAEMKGVGDFSKLVALKIIRPELVLDDREFVKQFISEARLGGYLSHPNIVETLDFGESDGQLYMAMEYVAGPTLEMVWEGCRRGHMSIPPRLALDIVHQVLDGLAEAHNSKDASGRPLNLVHRDLKPSNIFISLGGTVKVGDFGVARAESNVMRTMHGGALKGTVRYMSPEQAWGQQNLDHRSDLFSVAAILFELLSGRHLYEGQRYQTVLRMAQDGQIPDIQAALPAQVASVRLLGFLAQGLQKEPDRRFATAKAMNAALDKLRSGMPRMRLGDWLEQHAFLWDPTKKRPGEPERPPPRRASPKVEHTLVRSGSSPSPARPPEAPAVADAFAPLDRSGEETVSPWNTPGPVGGGLPQDPYSRFGELYSEDRSEAPTQQVDVNAMWEEIHRREAAAEEITAKEPVFFTEEDNTDASPPALESSLEPPPDVSAEPEADDEASGGGMSVLRFLFFGLLAVAILAGAAWLMTATVELERPGTAADSDAAGEAVRRNLSRPPPGVLDGEPANPEAQAPSEGGGVAGGKKAGGKASPAANASSVEPGSIFLNTFPPGRIAVDGNPVPGNRLKGYSLQAGEHEVTVTWGQGHPLTGTVTIPPAGVIHCVADSNKRSIQCQ